MLLCHLYLAPFHPLPHLLPCPGYLPYCVTFTWHSKLHSVTEEDVSQLCHLYLPQFIKKPGQYRKNDILPASAASQALQNSDNTSTELANPLKKSGKHASRSQKNEIETKKNNGIAALSIIINCFCRQNVTEKLENSGKDFNWRRDRTEDGEERAGRVLVGRQTVRLWWFYIILWLWNLIPKVFFIMLF